MSLVDLKSLADEDIAISFISEPGKENSQHESNNYKLVVVNPEKVLGCQINKAMTVDSEVGRVFIANFKRFRIEELMTMIGSFGRFQYNLLFISILAFFVVSSPNYSNSYFYAEPIYLCNQSKDGKDFFKNCSEKEYCSNVYKNKVDYHFESYVKIFDQICEDRATLRKNLENFYLFSLSFTPYIVTIMADKIGRARTICIASVQSLLCTVIMITSNEIVYINAAYSLLCGFTQGTVIVQYFLLHESIGFDSKMKSVAGSVMFLTFYFQRIFVGLITLKLESILALVLYFQICMTVQLFQIKFQHESPIYLFNNGKVTQFLESAKEICITNDRVEKYEEISDGILLKNHKNDRLRFFVCEKNRQEIVKKICSDHLGSSKDSEMISYLKLLFNCKTMCRIVLTGLIGGILSLIQAAFIFEIQNQGLQSISVNYILIGVANCVGVFFILFWMHYFRRKTILAIGAIIIIFAGILIFFMDLYMEVTQNNKVAKSLIASFQYKGSHSVMDVTLITMVTELFESRIRGSAYSISSCIAKLLVLFTPQYIALFKFFNLHVLTGCSLPFILVLPIQFVLPETLGKDADKFHNL